MTDPSGDLPSLTDVAQDARSRARTRIVSIWSDRLQLASVLATFSTSIDSVLFSLAVNQKNKTNAGALMTAAFAGALVFHAAAAILSYIAGFCLIQFKLTSARNIPAATQSAPSTFHSPKPAKHPAVHVQGHHPTTRHSSHFDDKTRSSTHTQSPSAPLSESDIFTRSTSFVNNILHSMMFSSSSHIYIEVVHPFSRRRISTGPQSGPDDDDPETNIDALRRRLLRCHWAGSAFSLAGVSLLLIGVISFAWTVLDRAVSIFTSCCVAVSLALALYALH